MDPNKALEDMLKIAGRIIKRESEAGGNIDLDAQAADGEALAYGVRDLDEWIRKGGFLPAAWSR